MKKILLSLAAASLALSATAQTVYFEEDFEWLKPWVEAGDNKGKPAGNTIAANDNDAYSPQLTTSKVEDVTTLKALTDKGYDFLATCKAGKEPREAGKQIYLQDCYLKFGLTDYFSGITLPAMSTLGEGVTNEVSISFDWTSMRQGASKNFAYDKTKLVVIVKNAENEKQYEVESLNIEDNTAFKWFPTTVKLTGATLNKDTRISIRNADDQWPGSGTLRYFLDNIKVFAADGSGVAGIEAEENAPVEYYNLQGIRVANPENGLYIVKQGNKVTKRVIK